MTIHSAIVEDLTNYPGQWRNIVFDVQGRSYRCRSRFNTASEALEQHETEVRYCQQSARNGIETIWQFDGGRQLAFSNYSHAYQVPA